MCCNADGRSTMHTLFHNATAASSPMAIDGRPTFGPFPMGDGAPSASPPNAAVSPDVDLGDVLRKLKDFTANLLPSDSSVASPSPSNVGGTSAGTGTNNNYLSANFQEQYKAYLLHYSTVLRNLSSAVQPFAEASPSPAYNAAQVVGVGGNLLDILARLQHNGERPAATSSGSDLVANALVQQQVMQLLQRQSSGCCSPSTPTPTPTPAPLSNFQFPFQFQSLLPLLKMFQSEGAANLSGNAQDNSCDAWRKWYQLFELCFTQLRAEQSAGFDSKTLTNAMATLKSHAQAQTQTQTQAQTQSQSQTAFDTCATNTNTNTNAGSSAASEGDIPSPFAFFNTCQPSPSAFAHGAPQLSVGQASCTSKQSSPLELATPGSQQQRFQCDSCQKSYSTFSGLTKHKQFHCVSQIKKQFNCKYCEKSYVSLGALKMHIRTHTLPCKCQICGKAFSRPWLLNGHIRTHTGEKPFKCDFCGRAFADRSNLRAHLQTHSDVKKYSCKVCNKTFSRMSLLVKHTETVCNAQSNDAKACSTRSISPSSLCSNQPDMDM